MTKDEFYEKLRDIADKFDWEICQHWQGSISGNLKGEVCLFCPITAVTYTSGNGFFNISEYDTAGELLGLSFYDIVVIVDASDNRTTLEVGIREKLLESIGLLPQA